MEKVYSFPLERLPFRHQVPLLSPFPHPGHQKDHSFPTNPMEKDPFFGSDGGDQLPSYWYRSGDHAAAQLESALSSLVSSPPSNPAPPPLPNAAAAAAADSVAIRELVARLGSICNSGLDMSPTSHCQSTTTTCYSTPLNSPAAAAADTGFSEQAATRLPCFSARPGFGGLFGETGKPPQSLKAAAAAPVVTNGAQLENGQEESSSTLAPAPDRRNGKSESSARKRKAAPKGKGKEAAPLPPKATEDDDPRAKRCKAGEAEAKTTGQDGWEKEGDAKPAEPPKLDYIRVRARRGQATDSHSLAERVRREKISERMKFLQDLVPGCNKVSGKAVMLDEIINYVQSLQRQVEFLSMKLATVNPRLDSLIQKDMRQPRGPVIPPHPVFPVEATTTCAGFPYGSQPQLPSLQSLVANGVDRRSLQQLPQLDGFVDASSQLGAFWEDDLQSIVQMDFGQNQAFQGSLPSNHTKIEL